MENYGSNLFANLLLTFIMKLVNTSIGQEAYRHAPCALCVCGREVYILEL